MSLNEEKDGEDPNKLAVPQNIQDELVRVIHMSLNNIAAQVDNINKHTEGILGALSKEVDKISCRYNTLQERVMQLKNSIMAKETSLESSLQAAKSSQSASIQTKLDYPSSSLPAKIRETHDVSVQTPPLYMSIPYCQEEPHVLAVPTLQDDTDCLIIPYYQDDLMIPYCQANRQQGLMVPYCMDSHQGLVVPPEICYYFETCEEKFGSDANEQVQERLRKKPQHVDHPIKPENGPKITLLRNDITVGHIPPTCIDLSPSHVDLPGECSMFSTYPINEISKVLTQAVGKVLASPPRPQRKGVRFPRNKESYVSYGVGKREIKPHVQTQNHPELEVFVSPTEPASPRLPPDWLAVLRGPKTDYPASKMHCQTQFPSPVLRTSSATHHHDRLQVSPEVGFQTTEEKEDLFSFPPPPPECCETITHNLLKEDNEKVETPPLSTSPVLLRRIETNDKSLDLLAQASFLQSPPSLIYSPSKPLFPQSPRLAAAKSPRPSSLSTPRSSHQPPTRYIGTTYSKSSNAAVPRHSSLETYQNSIPLSESFSNSSSSSVSPARCLSAHSPTRSVSSRYFDEQSSRFSIPSSGKTYVEQSTSNLLPPSQPSTSLKPAKPVTLQSLFSFPQSASCSVTSPQTVSVFQYSPDPVSSDPKRPPAFNKERSSPIDSIRKDVLMQQTKEHCILKAQIEISKK